MFGILLLLILVTCGRQFDLYLLSFSKTGSNFNSSKKFSSLLWSKRVYPPVPVKNFIWIDVSIFILFLRVQFRLHLKEL